MEAVGLGSITVDTSGAGSFIPRLRVRNRAEIQLATAPEPDGGANRGSSSERKTLYPSTAIPTGGIPGGVSIRGNFSAGAKLHVRSLPPSNKAGAALRIAALNHTVVGMQQLTLTGKNYGPIHLTFQVGPEYEGSTLTVLQYIEATGRVMTYTGEVTDGSLTVRVNSLGAFAVLSELIPLSATPPKTGDTAAGIGFVLLFVAGALGTACLVANRRRNKVR